MLCSKRTSIRKKRSYDENLRAYRKRCESRRVSGAREATWHTDFFLQWMDNLRPYAWITSSESGANTGAGGSMDEIIHRLGEDCANKKKLEIQDIKKSASREEAEVLISYHYFLMLAETENDWSNMDCHMPTNEHKNASMIYLVKHGAWSELAYLNTVSSMTFANLASTMGKHPTQWPLPLLNDQTR